MVEDEKTRTQLAARIDDALDLVERLRTELLDLQWLVSGENPVKDVLTAFDQQWMHRYGGGTEHYEFTDANTMHVKRWLKTTDADTVKARIGNYFNDRNRSLVERKHPFSGFVAGYNRYKVDRGLHPPNFNSPAYAFMHESANPRTTARMSRAARPSTNARRCFAWNRTRDAPPVGDA